MYSEALEIMDRNTVRYMMEEDKKEIEGLRLEGEELRRKNEERERQCQKSVQQYQDEIERLKQLLDQKA